MKKISEHQLSFMHAVKYYGENYPANTGGILHLYHHSNLKIVEDALTKLLNEVDILHYKFTSKNEEIYQFCGDKDVNLDTFDFRAGWQDDLLQDYFEQPIDINIRLYKVTLIQGIDRISVLFVLHHLISDSKTLHLLATKLLSALDNKPNVEINTYDEYLQEEANYLVSKQFDKDNQYWTNEVQAIKPTLVKSFKVSPLLDDISHVNYQLSKADTNKIDTFIRKFGGSPQILFELILAYELSLSNSSLDVTLGITTHNRNKNTASVAGMLVSTLPLRINLDYSESFVDNYKKIIIKHFETYRHRLFPYRHILKFAHDINVSPLFDAMVIFHSPCQEAFNLEYSLETLANKKSVLGLLLNIEKRTPLNQYMLSFDFKKSLFTQSEQTAYIKRVLHYLNIIITSPSSELKILGDVVKPLNSPLNDTLKLPSLLTLLKEQVARNPSKIALISHNHQITYQTMADKSALIAAKIAALKIDKQIIFIDVTDKIDGIISLLAVIKSNNTYAFFPENLSPKLKDTYKKVAQATFTINDDFLLDFDNYSIESMERTTEILGLYFTSGTAGEPKAVKIKDLSVINYCIQQEGYAREVKQLDSIINFSPFNFDISLENIFLSLLNGLTLVLGDLEKLNEQYLLNRDALSATPSLLQYLLENKASIFKSLRLIISGGEVLGKSIVHKIEQLSRAKLYNSYGPTETTIAVTYALVGEDEITLGKPFDGCSISIKNDQFLDVPEGYIGEIVIEGICLSAGYTKDYADSGFISVKEKNYYKTGDYGYIDECGNLNFVGRRDNQIKKHGVRIELAQIDKVLLAHPRVLQAKTVAVDQSIITLVVARGETKQSIYRYLKEALPSFYLPNQINVTDELSFNAQGKTKLEVREKRDKELFIPKTPYEKLFLKTLKKVLKIEELYESDTLFDVGADSLDILSLMVELDSAGIELPLTKFHEVSRISELISFGRAKHTQIEKLKTHKLQNTSSFAPIKHVLLLGSTGFLGAHVLYNLIKETNLEISVLVRNHDGVNAFKYFEERMNYYFDEPLLSSRIKLYVADISKPKFGLADKDYQTLLSNVDAILNCAAKVDYIGKKQDYIKSNIDVVKEMIEFSKAKEIPIFHTSTIGLPIAENQKVTENHLLNTKKYANYYLETKRLAEDILLEHKKETNKPVYILRIGNLMPRQNDYKFQINKEKNAIYQMVKQATTAINTIHKEYEIDVTPVDIAAEMIVNVLKNRPTLVTYHLYAPCVINLTQDQTLKIKNSYKAVPQKLSLKALVANDTRATKVPKNYIANVFKIWRNSDSNN